MVDVDKNFIKNFEDAQGLNYKLSDLTREQTYFKALTNFRFVDGYSLRGREGVQIVGQAGAFIAGHAYSYIDENTLAEVEQLIALNDNLWRLKSETLTIARVAGSATWSWSITLNAATQTFRFVMTQGGTPLTFGANAYIDLGTGFEQIPYSVYELAAAIDAQANFTCTLPNNTAKVNGTQSGVSAINCSITPASKDCHIEIWDHATGKLVSRYLTSLVANTSITFDSDLGTVNVLANQYLGRGAVPAASIPVATAGGTSITYAYWERVPHSVKLTNFNGTASTWDDRNPFRAVWASRNDADFYPPHFEDAQQSVYIFTSYANQTSKYDFEGYPFKYDGQRVYQAGLPKYPITNLVGGAIAATVAVAGNLDGVYKYKVRYHARDAKGIDVYGRLSEAMSLTNVAASPGQNTIALIPPMYFGVGYAITSAATVAANTITLVVPSYPQVGSNVIFLDTATGKVVRRAVTAINPATSVFTVDGGVVSLNNGDYVLFDIFDAFNHVVATNQGGAVTNVTQINLTDKLARHDFEVGDILYFKDNYTLNYVTRKISAISGVNVSWSTGDPVNLAANEVISTYLTAQIYRTKADGAEAYYFVAEVPISQVTFAAGALTVNSYQDNIADTGLGELLIEDEIDSEPDLPPRAGIGCLHQGMMFYARIVNEINSVRYSLVDNIEGVPVASRQLVIPSGKSGPIDAIGSDGDNRLAIFKKKSYYDVNGDFQTAAISFRTVREGDYGIGAQSSLRKVDGQLVGIGTRGFMSVEAGIIPRTAEGAPIFGEEVTKVVRKKTTLNLSRAMGVNDVEQNLYRCFIPGASSFSDNVMLVYDYEKRAWFNWSFSEGIAPSGGMFPYNDSLYHLSIENVPTVSNSPDGFFFRQMNHTTPGENYTDQHLQPTYQIKSQPYHQGSPSVDKVFNELKIWSLYDDYDAAQFVACALRVRTYRNFQASTSHTDKVITFDALGTFEKVITLYDGKARALQIDILATTIKQCPHITGFELVECEPYEEESVRS